MIRFPEKSPLQSWTQKIRSRYSETDRMGYVYYGRYLEYFEEARTELIRNLGISYRAMEEGGLMLPVVEAAVEYKSPIFYDEEMQVEVLIFDEPQVRLVTWYRVMTDRKTDPHVVGRVTLAFTDARTRRPCRAPESFLRRIKEHPVGE